MGLKDTTITFALFFIFSVSIIIFAISFANNNNASINIGDDPDISSYKTTSQTNADSYVVEINDTLTAYSKTTLTVEDSLQQGGIYKEKETSPLTAFKNIFGTIQSVLVGDTGGEYRFVFTTIISTVLLIIAWYWIKLLKGGNPE